MPRERSSGLIILKKWEENLTFRAYLLGFSLKTFGLWIYNRKFLTERNFKTENLKSKFCKRSHILCPLSQYNLQSSLKIIKNFIFITMLLFFAQIHL